MLKPTHLAFAVLAVIGKGFVQRTVIFTLKEFFTHPAVYMIPRHHLVEAAFADGTVRHARLAEPAPLRAAAQHFHRHAIVGADNNAHIRCRHAGTPVVLFERNGSLWMRLKNDGHVDTEPVLLPIGEPIEIAGASLVLEPWQAGTTGGLKA